MPFDLASHTIGVIEGVFMCNNTLSSLQAERYLLLCKGLERKPLLSIVEYVQQYYPKIEIPKI